MTQAHYYWGVLLGRMGEPEAAREALSRFQALHRTEQQSLHEQKRQQARLNQGWHWLRSGDAQSALERFREFPETPDSLEGLAAALSATGDEAGAVRALERALALAPGRVDLRVELARARMAEGAR